jgi:hypothetical protein
MFSFEEQKIIFLLKWIKLVLVCVLQCTNFYLNSQEKIKKLREDWQFVKNRGEEMVSQDDSVQGAVACMTRQTAASVASSPNVHTGKRQALA